MFLFPSGKTAGRTKLYTTVRDISWRMPFSVSLNTRNTPVPPMRSATVTGVPSKRVSARVVPLRVNVTGSVDVVPVGMAVEIRTVKYPAGGSGRRYEPRARSTVLVPTVVFVVRKYGIPLILVGKLLKHPMTHLLS